MIGKSKTNIQHSICPICKKEIFVHLRKVKDDGYFERNNIAYCKRIFEIVRCSYCGMVFVKNPLDPTRYKEEEALDLVKTPVVLKSRHFFLLALLDWVVKKLRDRKPRILEIGCGFGQLYQLANSKGYDYTAIEPSPIRAKALEDSKLSVFNGTVQEFWQERDNERFDIIVMDNVIEHMPFPLEVIERLKPLMASECYLILAVPNLNDIRKYILPSWGEVQWMPVGHVNYFTPHTLRYLLETSGFEIVHPYFVTHGIEFSRKIAYLIKLIIERYFKVYPFGLYLCARRRTPTKN